VVDEFSRSEEINKKVERTAEEGIIGGFYPFFLLLLR